MSNLANACPSCLRPRSLDTPDGSPTGFPSRNRLISFSPGFSVGPDLTPQNPAHQPLSHKPRKRTPHLTGIQERSLLSWACSGSELSKRPRERPVRFRDFTCCESKSIRAARRAAPGPARIGAPLQQYYKECSNLNSKYSFLFKLFCGSSFFFPQESGWRAFAMVVLPTRRADLDTNGSCFRMRKSRASRCFSCFRRLQPPEIAFPPGGAAGSSPVFCAVLYSKPICRALRHSVQLRRIK